VVCDAGVEPIVEARLAAEGFAAEAVLQLVLEGSLARAARHPAEVTLEPAENDDDWAALVELKHADFEESAAKAGQPPFARAVAEQMVETWRGKAGMRFWLGRAGGVPCAYLGTWAGREGLGMLESLFTLPGQRHRGIATALIERAIDAVRAEGAAAVLIGAAVDDTPRQMYVDLGFRPICLTREWLRVDPREPA
jgi:GNAT superfamily N-acetyltransferase